MPAYKKQLYDGWGNKIYPVVPDSGGSIDIDKIYPVGSIYLTTSFTTAEQVTEAIGGEWEAWGSGRVPVGVDASQTEFNTVGKTGGGKTHTHQYGFQYGAYYGMPALEHNGNAGVLNYNSSGSISVSGGGTEIGSYTAAFNGATVYQTGDRSAAHYRMQGNTQYKSNLPPYITCYMYRRIG